MDLAVLLVRSTTRAFYGTREILVIDALVLHEALRDDDLAYLMNMNLKDLHRVCGKLREERVLAVHTRPEWKEGNTRPHHRTWYYIDYRQTIDAIKWRLYTIDKEVQGTNEVATEKKEFFCNFCKAEWTMMEVLDNRGPEGFLCHRCGRTLHFEAERKATGHEQSTRLNEQFKFISDLLPRIDSLPLPECNFDRAFAVRREVLRDAAHQREETSGVDPNAGRPMSVKGLANTGPQSIAINISNSDGPTEAEREATRLLKEKIAQKNALPSWMSNSTVTGESFSAASHPGLGMGQFEEENTKTSETLVDTETSAQIDDMFARLKAEQAAVRAKELAEEADEEDEHSASDESEGGFEDVPGLTATDVKSAIGTKEGASGIMTREGSSSDERSSKRVMLEAGPRQVQVKQEEDSEEDEELEFEDV